MIGILIVTVVLLITYIILLQLQLRSINRQLARRLEGNTRQPVSLELINPELNRLTSNINKCLKAEEILRLESLREEKKFKELIANISHDLRTPLTAIKGYQQLLESSELSAEQAKKLQIAQKYSDELGSLIQNFFEYSYLVNADYKLNKERINLTNLVAECLAAAVTSFEERRLSVLFEEASAIYVMADNGMTTRIIQNLIRNCAAHSVGDIRVTVSASDKGIVTFENPVKDAAEIDVNRIFERFYTVDKSRSKASTGLGLSIVKHLTEQMGGTVGASLVGNHLAIRVEFPLHH